MDTQGGDNYLKNNSTPSEIGSTLKEKNFLPMRCTGPLLEMHTGIRTSCLPCKHTSRKHAYIILTPLNPTFI